MSSVFSSTISNAVPALGLRGYYTAPMHVSLADALAQYIWSICADVPHGVASLRVLLPSARACLFMRECLRRHAPRPHSLYPRLIPLGEAEEGLGVDVLSLSMQASAEYVPVRTLSGTEATCLMTQLLAREAKHIFPFTLPALAQLVQLSQALLQLIEECVRDQVPLERLITLDLEAFAEHWQMSAKLLQLVVREWPLLLAAKHAQTHQQHVNKTLADSAAWLAEHRPEYPVILAGSTGSVMATRQLMAVIAQLPQGAVIFPGLDKHMPEAHWRLLEVEPGTHPQRPLMETLRHLRITRSQVHWLGQENAAEACMPTMRNQVVRSVHALAECSDEWRHMPPALLENAFSAVHAWALPDEYMEADIIAMKVREALEQPEASILLVSPDKQMHKRLRMALTRYAVTLNDTMGVYLPDIPDCVFLQLVLDALQQRCSLSSLVNLCKHPLCTGGQKAGELRMHLRQLEKKLRRTTEAALIENWPDYLQQHEPDFYNAIIVRMQPLYAQESMPAMQFLRTLLEVAESLAMDDAGHCVLWREAAGRYALQSMMQITQAMQHLPAMTLPELHASLRMFMRGYVFRPAYGAHPRVQLVTPIEARLLSADLVIVCGLQRDVWPAAIAPDPWLNRALRSNVGLMDPQFPHAQAMHDISLLLHQPRVLLTFAHKTGGSPAMPSAIWQRMMALAERAPVLRQRWADEAKQWCGWHSILYHPRKTQHITAYAASPPLQMRPTQHSPSSIELLMCAPYIYYAKYVCQLRVLESLTPDVSAMDFGQMLHSILHDYHEQCPKKLPDDYTSTMAEQRLYAIAELHLQRYASQTISQFWRPRLFVALSQFATYDTQRRMDPHMLGIEAECVYSKPLPYGHVLSGRMDRLEHYRGGYAITDYKTGNAPSVKDVNTGLFPQLPLLALALQAEKAPNATIVELCYWQAGTVQKAAQVTILAKQSDRLPVLLEQAEQGVVRLLDYYRYAAYSADYVNVSPQVLEAYAAFVRRDELEAAI